MELACKRLARVVKLEKQYAALIHDAPIGVKEFEKWKIAQELAELLPLNLEQYPVKRVDPYAASPRTQFIFYPTETPWRKLATYHSYLMAGFRKPLAGNEAFCNTFWTADYKTQVDAKTAREARDKVVYGGGAVAKPMKKRGRPSKAVSSYNKAVRDIKLAERGKAAKSAKRKQKRSK